MIFIIISNFFIKLNTLTQPQPYIFRVSSANIAVSYSDFEGIDKKNRTLISTDGKTQKDLLYPHHHTSDSKFILLNNPNYVINSLSKASKCKFFAYSAYLSTVVFTGNDLGESMKPIQLTNQRSDLAENSGLWLESAFYNTELHKFQGFFHREQHSAYELNRTYKTIVYGDSLDGLSWQIHKEVLVKVGGTSSYLKTREPLIRGHGDFTVIIGDSNDYSVGKNKIPLLLFYFNQGTRFSDKSEEDGESVALFPDWNYPYSSWKLVKGSGNKKSDYQSPGLGGLSKRIPNLFDGGSVARQSQDRILLAVSDSPSSSGRVDLAIGEYSSSTKWSSFKDPFLQVLDREYLKYFNFADNTGSSSMDRSFYLTYSYRDALNKVESPFKVWNPKTIGQYSTIAFHKVKMIFEKDPMGKPKFGWQITRHIGKDSKGQPVQKVTWALAAPPHIFNNIVYRGIDYRSDMSLGYLYSNDSGYKSKMDSLYLVYSQDISSDFKGGKYRIFKNLSSQDITSNKFGYVTQFLGYGWKIDKSPLNIKTTVLREYQLGDSYGYFLDTETVPSKWGKPQKVLVSIEQ